MYEREIHISAYKCVSALRGVAPFDAASRRRSRNTALRGNDRGGVEPAPLPPPMIPFYKGGKFSLYLGWYCDLVSQYEEKVPGFFSLAKIFIYILNA